MNDKLIGLASDHAGYKLKQYIKEYLTARGYEYKDFGCEGEESCDYPDFAHPLGSAIDNGEIGTGIAVCGTGEGMAMTLNKHQHVRAALCWAPEIAEMTRHHNNANVLVMPARFVSYRMAVMMVHAWLTAEFAGGRHQRRIDKILLP